MRELTPRQVSTKVAVWAVAAAGLGALVLALWPSSAAGKVPPKLHGNNFFSNCRFSHASTDDPIVFPGQPGKSHAHTFFGNTSTDAHSTFASLRAAGTTCKPRADRAAYWVPTLVQNGREVRASKGQFYYVLRGYEDMHPFPAGLRMIAGDAHAHRPQSSTVTYWACGAAGVQARIGSSVPTCGHLRARFHGITRPCPACPARMNPIVRVKTLLELHLTFPDCWDGEHLDTPDHQSHMAYSRGYRCPATHPVKVPRIRLMIRYPIATGEGVSLASGGQLTGHADFFNAWDERALAKLVEDCFNDRPCNDPRARRSGD